MFIGKIVLPQNHFKQNFISSFCKTAELSLEEKQKKRPPDLEVEIVVKISHEICEKYAIKAFS